MREPCFDYNRRYQRDFTVDRLVEISKWMREAYRVAHVHCLDFDPALSRNLRPNERRTGIEQTLLDNAGRIQGVQPRLLVTRSGFAHVALYCGSSVMSVCYVRRPGMFPRPARYRQQLARDAQGRFDGMEDEIAIPEDASLYGILLHTPSHELPAQIGHLHLGFPHDAENRYIAEPTDLIMSYRPIYDLFRPKWSETSIEWRREVRTGSDDDGEK